MVRPTKQQILEVAEKICTGDEKFACVALEFLVDDYTNGSKEFKRFFGICEDSLEGSGSGWFGHPYIQENQLASSLALLLYAEARNDILSGKK